MFLIVNLVHIMFSFLRNGNFKPSKGILIEMSIKLKSIAGSNIELFYDCVMAKWNPTEQMSRPSQAWVLRLPERSIVTQLEVRASSWSCPTIVFASSAVIIHSFNASGIFFHNPAAH